METKYVYLGDKQTDPSLKGRVCKGVRKHGKSIRSKKGTMLVEFESKPVIVVARRLRKIETAVM